MGNLMTKAISEVITDRLKKAGKRFHANDNISDYINDKERDLLVDELQEKFEQVLKSLVIDTETDPNSNGTARRLAKMYVFETMKGRYYPQPDVASFPNDGSHGTNPYTGMVVVRSEIKSICSHHHQPVTGVAYIGVIPSTHIIGLSKYTRIAQHIARRGSLQEELTGEICTAIMKATKSNSVAVYTELNHGCCTNRGISVHSSLTQCTVLQGMFNDSGVKNEFFDNIKLQKSIKE
jgi:GTP cyclohydrolase I